ncbi:MAG TPA: glycosyltransferase, partial [Thermoanaerobaculia bacterium]|nr:glycosyltransferase [Thermoanaerobaculia bacterium]
MHVLHLIKGLGLGGAENLLVEAARHAGPEVRYSFAYFLPWKDALVAPLRAAGAEVTCFPAKGAAGLLARVPALARHLRRRRVDLLHAHLPLAGVAGRLAGRLAGVPVVYTEHNLMQRYHPLTRAANLATWRLQRQAVAVSAEVAASIAARAGAAVPVAVVANGVPVDR